MANNNVMNEMVGKWKLEKRDNNFDEFLSCRQVGWFLRKLMTSSVADVEYSLSQDANTFTKVIIVHKYFVAINTLSSLIDKHARLFFSRKKSLLLALI